MEQSLCQYPGIFFDLNSLFFMFLFINLFCHFLSTTTIPVFAVIPFAAVSRVLWWFQVAEFWCPGFNHFCMYTIISVHVSKSSFSAVFHRLVSLNIEALIAAYHWEFDLEKVSSAAFQIILVVLITGFFLQQTILTELALFGVKAVFSVFSLVIVLYLNICFHYGLFKQR